MNEKKQWGGVRPHPPGREGGRPKGDYPRRMLVITCIEAEYQEIIKALSTRQRAEVLIMAARHAQATQA